MIDRQTVERIIETTKIEEVVSDFVSLKKSGSNLKGLCPFHKENTPSMMVSPVKGIFKCFGCGKGGNAVNFVMEHEGISYPEALKWLANKYKIEIKETAETPEEIEKKNIRESLFVANDYAQKYFTEQLFKSDEGISIGFSYLRERGIRDDIIKLFQLGYSQQKNNAFYEKAIANGFKRDILEKAGLIKIFDNKERDMFFSRIIFPIHNISGRIVGFTGRRLDEKQMPKYLNTNETDIFIKGRVLYGLHLAKKAINQKDLAILVEGNTDVISLYQSGIENVVAGSGTALTTDQILLIKRFTKNVLIIYDNDSAGINAAIKNTDLLLKEGLNVKILLLPEGQDPDSFAQSHHQEEIEKYFNDNQTDFISFKLNYLLKESKNDPVKKAGLINQIISSISCIPDSVTRAIYVKKCSESLKINESLLYNELNKSLRNNNTAPPYQKQSNFPQTSNVLPKIPLYVDDFFNETEEKEILHVLFNYGNKALIFEDPETKKEQTISVANFIISEMKTDELEFNNLFYRKAFELISQQLKEHNYIEIKNFMYNEDETVRELAADLITEKYELSKIFKRRGILTVTPEKMLEAYVPELLLAFKNKVVEKAIKDKQDKIKVLQENNLINENLEVLLNEISELIKIRGEISTILKRPVTRYM